MAIHPGARRIAKQIAEFQESVSVVKRLLGRQVGIRNLAGRMAGAAQDGIQMILLVIWRLIRKVGVLHRVKKKIAKNYARALANGQTLFGYEMPFSNVACCGGIFRFLRTV